MNSDILQPLQQQTAAAYRRLADAALAAAEAHGDGDTRTEGTRYSKVLDRIESVKHARLLLDAGRAGVARGRRCA